MWKKSSQFPQSAADTQPTPRPEPRPEPRASAPSPASPPKSRIGRGIVLVGEVSGEEDLVIEGRVEGTIHLENHSVFVEESGSVSAHISARTIRVAGEVRGNITASERAVLQETARLEGDIASKGITIETGARFKGTIDMEVESKTRTAAATAAPLRETSEPLAIAKPNGSPKPVGVS